MPEEDNDHLYEIEVEYRDSGFLLELEMDQWWDRVEEDFSSFEDIKEFYRRDPTEFAEALSEHGEEIPPNESPDGPGIVVSNAPKQWKEDFSRAAPFLNLIDEQLVRMALYLITEQEVKSQQELLSANQFKPLLIRQSAFFEGFLELHSQLAFQDQKDGPLSNKEMSLIEDMGHTDRIRLAHLFDVIDEEEHGHLQSMASLRNQLAHSPWDDFDADQENNIKATAKSVFEILNAKIEQADDCVEEDIDSQAIDDFGTGFSGLEPRIQLLQLGILDVIKSQDEESTLSELCTVLPQEDSQIRQRTLRMDHIGYVDLDKESERVTLREKGQRLLQDELEAN
jgi:hypothetical protein